MQKHIDQQNRIIVPKQALTLMINIILNNKTLLVIFSYVYVSLWVYTECGAREGQNKGITFSGSRGPGVCKSPDVSAGN